jgi:hypothetical protein
MRVRIGLIGTALLLLVTGCAGRNAAGPGTPPVAAPVAPASSSSGCPQALTVTSADGGKSLCVGLGGTVTINWTGMTDPEADGTALVLKPGGEPPQTDLYDAKATGTVKFTSSKRACTPTPGQMACGALIAWNLTVEVK